MGKKRTKKTNPARSGGKPAFPVSLIEAGAVGTYDRARMAAAGARDAIDYRAQHRALTDDKSGVVERFGGQVPDSLGRPGNPHRVYDTLATLFRNGSIDAEELAAGRQFEETFRLACLDPLHAANLSRISGSRRPDISDVSLIGRDKVARALDALGGLATAVGAVVWEVLGLGRTIREFAQGTQFSGGRSMDERVARGLFLGAIGILAVHYGLKKK